MIYNLSNDLFLSHSYSEFIIHKYFLKIDKKCKDHRSLELEYSASKEERIY